jgi:nucleotide-binding universal stress UspA family protein
MSRLTLKGEIGSIPYVHFLEGPVYYRQRDVEFISQLLSPCVFSAFAPVVEECVMERILAFIDPSEGGLTALQQAIAIAEADEQGPEVVALHQVYDLPAQIEKVIKGSYLHNLTRPILADAEKWIEQAVSPYRDSQVINTNEPIKLVTEVVWGNHSYRAVASLCQDKPVDLVIKRADHRTRWAELVIHSDDWHLLSHAPTEVLMLDEIQNFSQGKLLLSLESFDPRHEALNKRILERACLLREAFSLNLHVLHAFPNMTNLPVYGLESASYLSEEVMVEIEKSHRETTIELVKPYGLTEEDVTVAPGPAALLIPEKVSQWQPDALMLGNLHEKGVPGVALTKSFDHLQETLKCGLWVIPG